MTLHGILPPDAGRLERAARRYAIAALSMHISGWRSLHNAVAAIDAAEAAMRLVGGWEGPGHVSLHNARILRARVALYLRWCERVERMRSGDCDARWAYVDDSGEDDWADTADALDADDVDAGLRWAVPLWTLAPAHDPAVTARDRRGKRA